MAPKNTAVAAKPQSNVASIAQGRGVEQFSQEELDEMRGMEGVGVSDRSEDRGTPLLYIAQKGSKQVNKKEPKYIEGLEVGDAFNPKSGKIWKAETVGVPFIPCFFQVTWNEWTPQEDGGGFHGQHHRDTALVRQSKAVMSSKGNPRRDLFLMDNGHELVLTHNYYGLIPDTLDHVVLALASTNLEASSIMQNVLDAQKGTTPEGRIIKKPSYFSQFLLKTFYDKNDSGDWYRWIASFAGKNEDRNLREYCKEIAQAGVAGQLKADMSEGAGDSRGGSKDDVI